ncbi:FTR1 family iron permease [Gloeobacter violaceus]|uniref:Gll3288 protein n=1 Tax=Gloeobacter violaceus (strain ATCC 29082 / PCC 7421) TaxID=251221 RepID=Q7NG85_GLOVI|nr:FTR1 family protein [Gloeobacter violaceus]BAC91229.1 gll3288 [Gloeobacter violaceus PCC 7421]
MDFAAALPTFAITLREGVEAALVVGIVLACLKKAGHTHLNRWVWGGVAGGLAASTAVGLLFGWLLGNLSTANQKYAPAVEPLLEGIFGVLAIGMLSWMLIWMTRQARTLKGQVEASVGQALGQERAAGWAIAWLILFTVLREGFETVLFVTSYFRQGFVPAFGAVAGILVAVAIAVLLFRWGVRIDLRRFFQTMGLLLLLIVSGLVVTSLGHFDAALRALAQIDRASESLCFLSERFTRNASCVLGPQVWDGTRILPENQPPGMLLGALFGYAERLYLVQALFYALFLVGVGSVYWQSVTGKPLLPLKSRGGATRTPTA